MEYERHSGPRGGEGDAADEEGDGRRGYAARRIRVCHFCVDKTKTIDYKNVEMLRGLVTDRGKIRPRRQTGTCARHQRLVAAAIKRARHMALLTFSSGR